MVNPLLEFAKSYVAGKMDAWVFSEAYGWLYYAVEGANLPPLENERLDFCLSCIFTTADCYGPPGIIKKGDLNDEQLLVYVRTEIERLESSYES